MRSLMLVALLAFLAVGFVAARPAEDEESAPAVVESADEDSTSNDADVDADESTDDEESADDGEDSGDSADESSDDADEEEPITAAPVKKQVRPFWPRFGGHGPVVVRPHRSLVKVKAQ
ncbi:nucleolin [Drosophila erecta]|uniref:Uncharacterized protein n=1 Tax=Drosophila erecta TaxID=7220 RepID=B3NHL7_DROER|nr:nucleolin [Drosophila erecta]EDV51812.1 uncharacterized protein Dere_GG13692 [Drosophila erecta]